MCAPEWRQVALAEHIAKNTAMNRDIRDIQPV
jgi:hypothetical protein